MDYRNPPEFKSRESRIRRLHQSQLTETLVVLPDMVRLTRVAPPRKKGRASSLKSALARFDVQLPGTYSTPVFKKRLTSLLLAFTVFTVQTSGVHVHAHTPSGATNLSEANLVHLALATDHAGDQGRHHDRDTELSPPDNGILKKAGGDKDLVALPALRNAPPAPLHLRNNFIATECHFSDRRARAFTRPLLRAPPTFHSV